MPNFQSDKFGIKLTVNDRRGRTCIIPPINTRALASVSSLVESSFPIRGPRLFNALPANVRNYDGSVDAFKARLDKFLALVPDQPCTPNYHQPSASNSILDQLAALSNIMSCPMYCVLSSYLPTGTISFGLSGD